MPQHRSYEESGLVPLEGIVALLVAALMGGGAAGAVVGALDHVLRVAHLNSVLGLAVAVLLGVVVGEAAFRGRVRSRLWAAIGGAAAGAVSVLVAWVVFAWLREDRLILELVGLLRFAESLAGQPAHGLGSAWPWWTAQAVAFLALPAILARRRIHDVPFCELCGEWIDHYQPVTFPVVADTDVLLGHLMAGEFDDLIERSSEEVDPGHYLRAELHRCDLCGETCYLTLVRVHRGAEASQYDEETLTELLELTPQESAALLGELSG